MTTDKLLGVFVNVMDPNMTLGGAGHFMSYVYEGIYGTGLPIDYSMGYVGQAGVLNIIVDGFDQSYADMVLQSQAAMGGDHILIATEFMTGGTFNDIGSGSSTYYDDKEWWQSRFDAFDKVARHARAIWVSTDHQLAGYREAYPGKPVLRLPFHFASRWSSRPSRMPFKLYDIAFFGTVTDRRRPMLEALAREFRVYAPPRIPAMLYPHFVSQSKVTLHLKLKDGWPYTSPMRHLTLLHCDSYVMSEASDLPGELDAFIETVPTDRFVEAVARRVRDPGLAEKTRQQRQGFVRSGDLKQAFATLLKASFDAA